LAGRGSTPLPEGGLGGGDNPFPWPSRRVDRHPKSPLPPL